MPLNVTALLRADCFPHAVASLELLETHISWVILTGEFAYKIKKPINLGFLDYSTLDKRRFACEEELRLNRRLAPEIYLELASVRGTPEAPHLEGEGEIIDYAVKMRQFPQAAQLDRLLQAGGLSPAQLDAIADVVAKFHLTAKPAEPDSRYGDADSVWRPVAENFSQIRERGVTSDGEARLAHLLQWSQDSFGRIKPVIARRKMQGQVRECHGDLHLRNIAWFHDRPVIFDCIEFNPELRWIDTISDFAFLFMDLIDRSQARMAYRVLDRYLVQTGDYAGLALLPFYFVYRAMVRAKVDRIRLAQPDLSAAEREAQEHEFSAYLQLAEDFIHQRRPILIITWGLSASGKSSISSRLLQVMGAVRLRSDVERKRLAGMEIAAHAAAEAERGIYTSDMSERVYRHLRELAEGLLMAGFPVIVDAAFLEQVRRAEFAQLARSLQIPFVILQCVASASTLRQRICSRQGDVSDADLSILEYQLDHLKPLSEAEHPYRMILDTEQDIDIEQLVTRILEHIGSSCDERECD